MPPDVNTGYQYTSEDLGAIEAGYVKKLFQSRHLLIFDQKKEKNISPAEANFAALHCTTQWMYRQLPGEEQTMLNKDHPVVLLSNGPLVKSNPFEPDFIYAAQNALIDYWLHHNEPPKTLRVEGLVNRGNNHWISVRLEFNNLKKHFSAFDNACTGLFQGSSKRAWAETHTQKPSSFDENSKPLILSELADSMPALYENTQMTVWDSSVIRDSVSGLIDTPGQQQKLQSIQQEISGALQVVVPVEGVPEVIEQKDKTSCGVLALYHLYECSLQNQAPSTQGKPLETFAKQKRKEHIELVPDYQVRVYKEAGSERENISFAEQQAHDYATKKIERPEMFGFVESIQKRNFLHPGFLASLFKTEVEKQRVNEQLQTQLDSGQLKIQFFSEETHLPDSFHLLDVVSHTESNKRSLVHLQSKNASPLVLFGTQNFNVEHPEKVGAQLENYVAFHFNQQCRRMMGYQDQTKPWSQPIVLPPEVIMGTVIRVKDQWTPIVIRLTVKDSVDKEAFAQALFDFNQQDYAGSRLTDFTKFVKTYYAISYTQKPFALEGTVAEESVSGDPHTQAVSQLMQQLMPALGIDVAAETSEILEQGGQVRQSDMVFEVLPEETKELSEGPLSEDISKSSASDFYSDSSSDSSLSRDEGSESEEKASFSEEGGVKPLFNDPDLEPAKSVQDRYDEELTVFTEQKQKYAQDLKKYETAQTAYQLALAEYQKEAQEYQQASAQYQKDKAAYDAAQPASVPLWRRSIWIVLTVASLAVLAAGAWPLLVAATGIAVPTFVAAITVLLSSYSVAASVTAAVTGLVGLGLSVWDLITVNNSPQANAKSLILDAEDTSDLAILSVASVAFLGIGLSALAVGFLPLIPAIISVGFGLLFAVSAYSNYADARYKTQQAYEVAQLLEPVRLHDAPQQPALEEPQAPEKSPKLKALEHLVQSENPLPSTSNNTYTSKVTGDNQLGTQQPPQKTYSLDDLNLGSVELKPLSNAKPTCRGLFGVVA